MITSPPGSWVNDKQQLEKLAKTIDPSIKLYLREDSLFIKALGKFLSVLMTIFTLGQKKYDLNKFMHHTASAIGPWHHYPLLWSTRQVRQKIFHEGRHTQQSRWCGCGIHPVIGLPLNAILYGLTLFPVFAAIFRFLFEMDANIYEWKELRKQGATKNYIEHLAEAKAKSVCGKTYFYSIPHFLGIRIYRWAVEKFID